MLDHSRPLSEILLLRAARLADTEVGWSWIDARADFDGESLLAALNT
jgi:hypothetical protein